MKIIFLILMLLIFFACNRHSKKISSVESPTETYRTLRIKLVDSLGNVSISLPTCYDTSFSWTDHSDCGKPCDEIKYRFQPKGLKIKKESGWFRVEQKDSIERFTIIHSGYFEFHNDAQDSDVFIYHRMHKEFVINEPEKYKIKKDTIEKIGDRYFSIIIIDFYDFAKSQFCKKLLATTTIKSNEINFDFELLTKKNDSITKNFINNSKLFLRTARLSVGR